MNSPASFEVMIEPPDSEAARTCLAAYFDELAERFQEGFDPGNGGTAVDMAMAPPHGCFLVARLGGRPVGCGGFKRLDATTAEIKRMWVAPATRGRGLAGRLVTELEARAGQAGYRRVVLDTNRSLTQAQALYLSRGYTPIDRYNDNPYADHWFETHLSPE